MLILGSRLVNYQIMSLQTGSEIARTKKPVIDPADFKILGYTVTSPLIKNPELAVRIDDIRELSEYGFIVDSIDECIVPGDVMKFDEIKNIEFDLISMKVVDEKNRKLGKVVDYTIDVDSFMVQQLTVRRSLFHSFSDAEILIHRTQIRKVTNDGIVVESKADVPEHTTETTPGSYINPFRKPQPTTESGDYSDAS